MVVSHSFAMVKPLLWLLNYSADLNFMIFVYSGNKVSEKNVTVFHCFQFDCDVSLSGMQSCQLCNLHFYRTTACNTMHSILNASLSVCLSVCLSVYLSNACIVTKRKKLVPTFLCHMKDHSS